MCHLGEGRSALLRFSEGPDALSLDLVLVPSKLRNTGVGSQLVGRLLALADWAGKPVRTTARPIGRNTPQILARLVGFYERYGFRGEGRGIDCVMMRRPPRPGGEERS